MVTIADLIALLPQLIVAATVVILLGAVAIGRRYGVAVAWSLIGLAAAIGSIFIAGRAAPAPVTQLFAVDGFSLFFTALVLACGFVVVLFSSGYIRFCQRHGEEYYLLLLLAVLGATVLVAASHFVSFFLGLELLGISLYALIAYVRGRAVAIEAGVKYLILAALSSAFLLFGMALVYMQTGTMQFAELALTLRSGGAAAGAAGEALGQGAITAPLGDPLLLAGLGLATVGFGFKLAVVPFHMWTPDIYQGAPAPVTAFVATASKGAVMALLVRFAGQLGLLEVQSFWMLIAAIAVASMFTGNLLALRQQSLKRLLAYSSIAHLGYVLVAFLAGGERGFAAVAFYLVAYALTTLGAFGLIAVLSSHRQDEASEAAGDVDDLTDYRGLGRRRPWLALVLALMLLSLGGIPLTAGFVGKFLVIAAGADAALWTLIILLAINGAIGIYYYLRVIVGIYLQPPPAGRPAEGLEGRVSAGGALALTVTTLLVLWLGLYPGPLLRWITAGIAAAL